MKPPGRGGRVSAALAAGVVAAAGGLVAVRAILGSGIQPPPYSPQQSAENGVITYLGQGPAGGPGVDNIDLFGVDPSTGHRWNLTDTRTAVEREPVWSPDGTRVLFFRTSVEQQGNLKLSSHEGLYLMNADGSEVDEIRPCEPPNCTFRELTWSPDGTHVAFVDGETRSVHAMDPDGANELDTCTSKPRWRTCGQSISEPTWSPDGRWIAYAESAPTIGVGISASSILVAAADGSGIRRLTGGGCLADAAPCFHDSRPEWSLDGSKIAFTRYPVTAPLSPGGESMQGPPVYIVDVASGRIRHSGTCNDERCSHPLWAEKPGVWPVNERPAIRVRGLGQVTKEIRTCDAEKCVESRAALISPDGKAAAIVSQGPEGELFTIDIASGTMRRIAEGVDDLLRWLPRNALVGPPASAKVTDTTRAAAPEQLSDPPAEGMIAFVADPTENSDWNLYVVRADGSGFLQLSQQGIIIDPSWSLDGERIYYVSIGDYGGEEIYSIHPDGTDERLVATGRGMVSADGTRVAFSERGPNGGEQIWVMNEDGSERKALTNPPLKSAHWSPRWSPDGSRILYEHVNPSGSDLYLVEADGSGQRQLTDLPGTENEAVWSPDGTQIAFHWWNQAGSDTYLMNVDGTGMRRLAEFRASSPVWSPDGSSIAFVGSPMFPNQHSGTFGSWIYAMRLEDGAVFTVFDATELGPMDLAWGPPGH